MADIDEGWDPASSRHWVISAVNGVVAISHDVAGRGLGRLAGFGDVLVHRAPGRLGGV